jgi:hypothetical protein
VAPPVRLVMRPNELRFHQSAPSVLRRGAIFRELLRFMSSVAYRLAGEQGPHDAFDALAVFRLTVAELLPQLGG